ncbi:MAG: SGNH/GDSL hydrolase family protein, partial [Candidatus Aenigmarchaeota archaeon]|nr:SGNH/GDSL hydrolase family protein [Candidatus Aenigmarchaeota archaeon]
FSIGGNDSAYFKSKKDTCVQADKYGKNLEKLIHTAREFSDKIVFLEIIPVDETRTTPLPWHTDAYCYNENINKFNSIIRKVCDENSIPVIRQFDAWMKTDYKRLLDDGVHPNTKGHEMIYESVKDFL